MSEKSPAVLPLLDRRRAELRADCGQCAGLCCVVPAFTASADFAIDKPAGRPCPNLQRDFGCGVHDRLRPLGFAGCTVYDCFGAGQKVSRLTFGGDDWRATPGIAETMFEAFTVMRQLHELLWYVNEALDLPAARSLHPELRAVYDDIDALTRRPADALVTTDPVAPWRRVNALLLRASELVRAQGPGPGPDRRGADLIGADLCGAKLRGANLRGTYLVGANLTGADLRDADLIGADLRGAELGRADLRGAIFVTQAQVDAARGDRATRLPAHRQRPPHWTA